MAYQSKPKSIRFGSRMHDVLTSIYENGYFPIDEFDNTDRKDALYPAARHGLVKIYKTGSAKLTKCGKRLVESAV